MLEAKAKYKVGDYFRYVKSGELRKITDIIIEGIFVKYEIKRISDDFLEYEPTSYIDNRESVVIVPDGSDRETRYNKTKAELEAALKYLNPGE